jgi:hypothetical protein
VTRPSTLDRPNFFYSITDCIIRSYREMTVVIGLCPLGFSGIAAIEPTLFTSDPHFVYTEV